MINIGLVGCGRISKKHFEAINQYNEINLLAICDNDADVLESAYKKTNAIQYDNYDLLLENNNIDVIEIGRASCRERV